MALTIYTPKPKIDLRLYFTAGMKVEVNMQQTRFLNSRFVATIITPPGPPPPDFKNPNKTPYLNRFQYEIVTTVEYDNIMEDDGVTKMRETVDYTQIRPIPPMEKKEELVFDVGDFVDVFIDGGWWEGLIHEVLCQPNEYEVYFKYLNSYSCFDVKELRIHRKWKWFKGVWVPPLFVMDDEKEKKSEAI